jgi:hypothetical protein
MYIRGFPLRCPACGTRVGITLLNNVWTAIPIIAAVVIAFVTDMKPPLSFLVVAVGVMVSIWLEHKYASLIEK